ncbi:MAG: type II secretion system protein N, partial [bacterium]
MTQLNLKPGRGHVLAANICLAVLLSYVLADLVADCFRMQWTPTPTKTAASLDRGRVEAYSPPPRSHYAVIEQSGLFGTASAAAPAQPNRDFADVPLTNMNLILKGTVTGSPAFARALIQQKGAAQAEFVAVGEEIDGARLVEIYRDKIILQQGDQLEALLLYDDAVTNPGNKWAKNSEVKVLSRTELNHRVFNNIDNVSKGVAVAPNFVDGRMDGFRVTRLEPNSVINDLGLRKNDIIKRVNGHKIDNLETALRLWENLKYEPSISVDVERNSKIVNLAL